MTPRDALPSAEAVETSYQGTAYGKAAVAGLIGGAIATVVKTLCEGIAPPRPQGTDSPLATGIRHLFVSLVGHEPDPATLHLSEVAVHWVFGIGMGAAYAVLVEKDLRIAAGRGAAFGIAFWIVFHELVLPLIGWSPSPVRMTAWEQGNELVSHLLYGIALEMTRRIVRAKL